MLQDEKLKIEVAVLPDQLDPDEYIRKYGPDSYKTDFGQAAKLYFFYHDACKTQ